MPKYILALVIASLLPAAALANGYNVPNTNTRDLGLADSARASQDSAAAVYGNPAALAGLPGLNVSVGLSLLDLRNDWKGPDGGTGFGPNQASMKFKPVPPPALFVSYGGMLGERSWGVGAGMNIPQGGNVFWPDNWAGRFRIVEVDRKIYGFYASGGIEVLKQLKLGGGLVYYRTTETLKQATDFVASEGTAELAASGGAFSYDLSALITPVDDLPFTIGVDYKHQGVQKLTGEAHFTGVPAALAPQLQDQGVTHILTIPNVLNVGVAFRPVPQLNVTAGFTFDRYVVYPSDVFAGDRGVTVLVPRDYGNGHTYRLGAEYTYSPAWTFRAGVLRDISGLKTDTYSPTLPDSNTWAGAVGASWSFMPDLAAHAALWYAHLDQVTATGTEAFAGSYQPQAFIYSLALTYTRR